MAKVVMPLGGIEARGKIADTFVYFPWKGINCVRSYTIPANPNTAGQQAQRTKMTNAVDKYHETGFTAKDIAALRRLAGVQKSPMTQFNVFCKKHIANAAAGDVWNSVFNDLTGSAVAGHLELDVECKSGLTLKVKYGTSPTFMPNVATMDDDGDETYSDDIADLDEGAVYYFYYYVDQAGQGGEQGIYTQKIKVT